MHAPDAQRRKRRSGSGPERFFLGAALLVPLGVVVLALMQLPAIGLASPSLSSVDASVGIASKRPIASNPAPPPTLVPPTATPQPTATPVPPAPAAAATLTPQQGGTYVVQPGDQLKHIAADHGVTMSKLIAANNIPDPDSLKIGQELRIPSD